MAGLSGDATSDLGCALEGGAFERLEAEDGQVTVEISPPDLTLMFFLVRLFRRLKKVGTAPAIDIAAYAPSVL